MLERKRHPEKSPLEVWSDFVDAHREARANLHAADAAFQRAFETGIDVLEHLDRLVAAKRTLYEARARMVTWLDSTGRAHWPPNREQKHKPG
jgi:hypothetical protein